MPADAVPAYQLWVELATRVTSQAIQYRAGDEETAAKSVHEVFKKARDLIGKNPEAAEFRVEALKLLNVTLRPYTTRWHGWMTVDKSRKDSEGRPVEIFRDELVRRMFRAELQRLRGELEIPKKRFAELAGVIDHQASAQKSTAELGRPIMAGIGGQIDIASAPGAKIDLVPASGAKADSPSVIEQINQAERTEILKRRGILAGKDLAESPLTNAIGLALSGGGIRSATYCLGIVQVLVRQNLFAQFDYLSTVSGGGYLGTFLSCALGTGTEAPGKPEAGNEAAPPPITSANLLGRIQDVFHRQDKGTESGLIRHLRNNSKYLLNGGFTGKLKIAGLLVSGIIWNMLMVLPIPLFAGWFAFVLANHTHFWGPPPSDTQNIWSIDGSVCFRWMMLSLAGTAVGLLLLPFIEKVAHGKKPSSRWVMLQRVLTLVALALGVITVITAVIYLQPALFYSYGMLRLALEDHVGLLKKISSWTAPAAAGTGSVFLGLLATTLSSNWPRLKGVAARLFILSGPVFFLLLYLMTGNLLGLYTDHAPVWCFWLVIGSATALALWSLFAVNINTLAPHVYYRAKLCECYLTRRVPPAQPEKKPLPDRNSFHRLLTGEFAQNRTESLQQVPLAELGAYPAAPYHLINTTLNLPGSNNKELRGRNGDFFVISKHFCGAPTVGYRPTQELVKKDPHLDLGTAMAISAAAASTSMGWKSLPNFRFLMTMLNVRLGYWLRWNSAVAGPGVLYFFREMLASMDERGSFLNLSDGGHQENLAAYELLRRRCKFIVCVDGGQEPGMECADLTRLQRYAEIDLGAEFEYGIADLSVQPNGFSRASAILVKIIYSWNADDSPDEIGWMVYLKLAVTGIEPVYVLDYRRENPDFPHQSTADQIYDEAQFEAYRRLGECAAENLFREELFQKDPDTVNDWFQGLANNLLADNDPVFKTPAQAIAAAGAVPEPAPAVNPPPQQKS